MESGAIFMISGIFIMLFGVFFFNDLFHEILKKWEPLFSFRRLGFILFGLALFSYGESVNKKYQKTDLFKTRAAQGQAEAWCQDAFRVEVTDRGLYPLRFSYNKAKIESNRVTLTARGGIGYPNYDVECWMDRSLKKVVSITLSTR